MKLLENYRFSIKLNKCAKIDFLDDQTINVPVEDMGWAFDYAVEYGIPVEKHNEYIRDLTIDEKVQILYNKAINGTAKEYRQICEWIYENNPNGIDFEIHFHYACADLDDNPIPEHVESLKQTIRKTLENSTKTQNL